MQLPVACAQRQAAGHQPRIRSTNWSEVTPKAATDSNAVTDDPGSLSDNRVVDLK